MRMTFEGNMDEICKVFNVESISRIVQRPTNIVIGKTTFTCNTLHLNETFNHNLLPYYEVCVELYDKKEEDIRKAKALVNKAKEEHKEAQRILSALMEEK